MSKSFFLIIVMFANSALAADVPSFKEVAPDPRRGVFGVWVKGDAANLSFLRGGQVNVQWADVEPQPGTFDFSTLDEQLAAARAAKRPVTVQVNGNHHPAWLFEKVPHFAGKLSPQVSDKAGTLMYWHPAYIEAYMDLLAAYGKHLNESPDREWIVGVRLNYNALGTEHTAVSGEARDLSKWVVPVGVDRGPAWDAARMSEYQRLVVEAFVKDFTPGVHVFVRNGGAETIRTYPGLADAFDTGQLGLFHTSSEMEPRGEGTEKQYRAFLAYARTGKTLAYAEPWADSEGRHGGIKDARWCPPAQWNYWRLLVDLNCGVSFISIYGADLNRAKDPEFQAAFDFAARYAGYHASPSVSPGGWVAMREGEYLKGDYTFLMRRLDRDESRAVKKVGPEDQRFGAWARVIPAGGRARLAADERFVQSLQKAAASLRVTYLDQGAGRFTVMAGGKESLIELKNTGRWQTAEIALDADSLKADTDGAHFILKPQGDLTVHMIEIARK